MSLEAPAVITCSISGSIATRDQCPAIPYTPEEYAAEARRIVDEGGVHIHIHARSRDGRPSYEIEDFQALKGAFVMGVVGGVPAGARNLAAMADNMPAGEHHWGVIGIGRDQWMLVAAALT